MKVVITGGCGYIGSKIIEKLKGYNEIIIFDNFSTSVIEKYKNVDIVKCDITDFSNLKKIKISNVDAVLHLAAQSSGPLSIKVPEKDIDININGTLNIIKWCIENNVNKLLFASSFVVYGDHEKEILTETDYCHPKSIYSLSKLYCERLLDIYASHHGVNWSILRQFNVYGPGQDLSRSDQGMVSIFMKMVMDRDYIGVKGSLDRFRDFIHIDDIVSGWIKCLEDNKYRNQIYNLGSGSKTTIKSLIKSLGLIFNKAEVLKFEQVGNTPGDILGCFADISKISNNLGYNPKYDLISGLRNMAQWAKKQK